jgi:hypothetical protein
MIFSIVDERGVAAERLPLSRVRSRKEAIRFDRSGGFPLLLSDPIPPFLRQPSRVIASDADDEHRVILVDVRCDTLPNALGTEVGVHEPSRFHVMPTKPRA